MNQPMTVLGAGMVTGVGLSGPTSCAAIRCGINNFRETRFLDKSGEWIVASEAPLEEPWRGPEKLGRMLASVIAETFAADVRLLPEETPVIMCFSERERPGRLEDLNERVLEVTERHLGFALSPASMTITQGRVGAVVALREARALLYDRGASAVIIAAADSYLSAQTINAYIEKRRLLTADNSNGFVPGEAAAAVIVRRTSPSEEPQLVVVGIGFGVEKSTIESEEPLRADGLVQAIKSSLAEARAELGALDFRITDVTGEHYGFKEASLAMTRILRTRKAEFDFWHATDCIAETGSAAGPIALNYAWHASEEGYSKGNNILCHFGNDDGKRASIVMTYQPVGAYEQ
jgi:3-oxoacyl-[acyl-carrier-protein] synthase-1